VTADVWSCPSSFTELAREEALRSVEACCIHGKVEALLRRAVMPCADQGADRRLDRKYVRAFADQIRPYVPRRAAATKDGWARRLRPQRLARQPARFFEVEPQLRDGSPR